ncbi:tRNA threonylcarbamoyladenosine biosynthesis protein TsaB [Balneicella halophila]|uniref:tRNA threonylcarbamoyladenosine biosynthesis protein TsaB n=1 Tax=Balneicella halophila TaxID=1537566 RepID=A0A7L4USY7_BALHA|nr:tRNA (adenosine(37)-N6)-threonylcarbamoyltransferase complex dimerization subunit type 1 TsaB [Balneicella halophila]PVX52601.1 tRNA threonylcarbamoyladenosine biosynthesis protein TsaB [Balneicella halophila]
MALILNIETSTAICSVALGNEGELVAEKIDTEGQNHAKLITVLIKELLKDSKYSMSDIDAVAISQGPGSYTGLRIGTSVAKGICYALQIPLLTINTLQALANNTSLSATGLRCPMIDARRMEVYCQLFNADLKPLSEIEAKILDEKSFSSLLEKQEIAFFGNGAEKFSEICHSPKAKFFNNIYPKASQMILLAQKAYLDKDFTDVAYFTPFYLKKFQVTTSKKKLL